MPLAEKAVERNIDVNDDHAALRFEQMNVVDDFSAAAVHVQNRFAHQVLVQQHPTGMIDKGRIFIALGRRLDEDGVVVDLDDPIPRDKLGRVAPAVLDIDADGFGIGLAEAKHQVGHASDAVLDFAGADGAVQEIGEIEKAMILRGGERIGRFCRVDVPVMASLW